MTSCHIVFIFSYMYLFQVMHTMCSAVFSSNVFHLLIGGIDSQSKSPAEVDIWLPGNITLQGVDSKLTQLQSLKKTLFRHLGTVGSKQWDLRCVWSTHKCHKPIDRHFQHQKYYVNVPFIAMCYLPQTTTVTQKIK